MKQAQWTVAIVVLAGIIFGVTFVLNYIGNTNPGGGGGSSGAGSDNVSLELTFARRRFPPDGHPELDLEKNRPGYQDFWFVNDNDRPVKVGLDWKNCKCSSVQLFVMPDGYEGRRETFQAVVPLASAVPDLAGRVLGIGTALLTAAIGSDPVLKELEAKAESVELGEKKDSHPVPAGAVGRLRVGWSGDRANQAASTVFTAKVWMHHHTAIALLETRVRFHEPLRLAAADLEQKLDTISPQDLPRKLKVVCWSSTRPTLDLEAAMLSLRSHSDGDPFEVGKPEALSAEECRELEKKQVGTIDGGQVLCAYRLPVTLREKSGGGLLLPLGPFRRKLQLGLAGEEWDKVNVTFTGNVQGDVEVSDDGRVQFGPFPRRRGNSKALLVWSDTPGLRLEIDRQRTASFLDVRLNDPEKGAGGRQTWRLEIRVPAERVSGAFPRDNNPVYRDSAVYLKTAGPTARNIRIPVAGLANE